MQGQKRVALHFIADRVVLLKRRFLPATRQTETLSNWPLTSPVQRQGRDLLGGLGHATSPARAGRARRLSSKSPVSSAIG